MGWRRLRGWFFHNGTLKLFSLAFAFGLWLLVNAGERDTEQTMLLPVELRNLAPQLVVVGQRVEFVDVRVSGPRTLLSRLSSKKITLDLSGVRSGPSSFRVNTELLNLPRGVKLLRITPSVISLDIARMVKRIVPVRVEIIGKPPFGYSAGEIDVSPSTVEVSGPAPQIEKIQAVGTDPVEVSLLTQSTTRELQLQPPEGELVAYSVDRVRARIEIQEVIVTKEFRRLRAQVKNTELQVTPTFFPVDVSLRGPQRIVEKLKLSSEEVFVDAGGRGPGVVSLPVTVLLPPEVELVAQDPPEVEIRLIANDEKKSQNPPISGKRKKSGA
jgi:YbbR domain-containing protein